MFDIDNKAGFLKYGDTYLVGTGLLVLVSIIVLAVALGVRFSSINTLTYRASPDEAEIKNLKDIERVVEPGDTASSVMASSGILAEDIKIILAASQGLYDLTKIRTGQVLHFIFAQEALAAVEYDIDGETKIVVEKKEGTFEAREEKISYDVEIARAESSITSSLFTDASTAGLEDKTIVELADIFAWDIDFATDIQSGDSFKIIYEKRSQDGKPARAGSILAAHFTNQGKMYTAIGYADMNGGMSYYDENGNALTKQFLKSPLQYSYISTQYTNSRINPVTKKMDTHKAIDYAAPAGTPILASADGTVTYSGWKGGYGIDVELQHGNSYNTLYAHLSRIAKGISNGATVTQGQVIGYVGSTGISTGPHLHFAMYKDGTPLNPLTADLPQGQRISEEFKSDFDQKKESLLKTLE